MRFMSHAAFSALLLTVALPLAAQEAVNKPDAMETYRTRTVTVYGLEPCPVAKTPDEIVVCARRPEAERYRLPNPEAKPGDRIERGGTARLGSVLDLNQSGGTGSCSTVGPGGATGCFLKEARTARATARQNQATVNPETPEDIITPR